MVRRGRRASSPAGSAACAPRACWNAPLPGRSARSSTRDRSRPSTGGIGFGSGSSCWSGIVGSVGEM